MKSIGFHIFLGRYIFVILYLSVICCNANKKNDDTARSLYIQSGLPLTKGGWRPILTPENLAQYNYANVLGGHAIGHKILTGPAVVETKIISPHIVGVSPFTTEIFGNGIISTSTRPIVTRDASKLTTIPQSYKGVSHTGFPQGSINLNSPVKTYYNPFSIPTGPGVSTYKVTPGFQYDIMKHQQLTHRPVYNKIPGHNSMLGKRIKQSQSHIYPQFTSPAHHQQLQYQNGPKKQMQRPSENVSKYNTVIHHHQNYVNPQESLLTQTKSKPQSTQNVAVVTYKPPFSTHFQQFGIKEEPFGPIPSSILGSFSSFGHASVKARDPTSININNNNNNNKVNYISSTTVKPFVSTTFASISSTAPIKIKSSNSDKNIVTSPFKQLPTSQGIKDDYTFNLVPPPKTTYSQNLHKLESKHPNKGAFVPSPPDPLSKYNNALEMLKPLKTKQNEPQTYNANLSTRRPEIASFFDSTSSLSTIDPFDSQSTNAIPDNLLVQLPSPYTTVSSFDGSQKQTGKLESPPKKESYQVYHGKVPAKLNAFDTNKYFPSSTGHDFFGTKFPKNTFETSKDAQKAGYEVTENWASSGETNTQPTLHTWVNKPINPYKPQSSDLQPPPLPVSYPPTLPSLDDFSTVFSIPEPNSDKNKGFFSQLENSFSSLDFNNKPGDEVYDLATPLNVSDEKPKVVAASTTPTYDDITTQRYSGSRRKPSRYRPHYETSTANNIEEDFTTRFETFKDQKVTENESQVNELPTLPPHKHFRRPSFVTTTPTSIGDNWDDLKSRRNNKPRRRRPLRVSSTTEAANEEAVTEESQKSHRFRTTTPSTVEDATKPIKPRIRLPPYRSRLTTKPTSQPELTSSAQPTSLPTSPVTTRPKLHSRIRITTLPSLDFEDLSETTTARGYRQAENNDKQSSIMKIAKDKHSSRTSLKRLHATLKEVPDYSHKQDEKDTPTSDIAVSTSDHRYSAQKLQNEDSEYAENTSQLTADEQRNSAIEVDTEQPSSVEIENYPKSTIETSQTVRNEQFTELKYGNRGNIKSVKSDEATTESSSSSSNEEAITTTAAVDTQNKRFKLRPGKFENTRPRFSVKDYRNRLNQYTSTSTDKPTFSSETSIARVRFPTRSRFPSFKEQHEQKDVSTSTEGPRKKFIPKDPRHRFSEDQQAETQQDNEVISKPKVKTGLRRDPNRAPTNNVTDIPQRVNTYANLKRPLNRKRIHKLNSTEEEVEVPTTTPTPPNEEPNESSTERPTSETAIMKIAKEDRKAVVIADESSENTSMDLSKRVSDLTLASSKDYNTPGLFKSISPNSRKVPNYFTIATDDPILPIEAFFPQLNQKKETSS